jgi:hypothetical protein
MRFFVFAWPGEATASDTKTVNHPVIEGVAEANKPNRLSALSSPSPGGARGWGEWGSYD